VEGQNKLDTVTGSPQLSAGRLTKNLESIACHVRFNPILELTDQTLCGGNLCCARLEKGARLGVMVNDNFQFDIANQIATLLGHHLVQAVVEQPSSPRFVWEEAPNQN
jgi:hypothetical protein